MSKLSNTLLMIEYLSSGKKISIKELSEKLEVSPRMVRVYKDELEKAGIYVDTIKGPYGGYVLNQDINVPKRFIIPKDIVVKDKEIFNIVNKSIKDKHKCYLEYYSKTNEELTKRIIHPYDLILYGNEWGVAAYCENKKDMRHFYLNRIKSIKELEEKY